MTMRRLAYWLTIAFVFSIPWEAAIHVSALGKGSKFLGLTAGAVWLLSALGRGRIRQLDMFQKAYFVFLLWNAATFFWTIDPEGTVSGLRTYPQVFFMLVILWDLLDSRRAIDTALQAYVLGAYITSASVINNFVTAPDERFPAHLRVNALGFETDGVALIIAIAGPAAWYLAVGPGAEHRHRVFRAANLAYLPLGALALVATGTRGATLASLPTIALVLWSLRRASVTTRVVAAASVVAAVIAVVQFAPSGPLSRIGTVVTVTELGDEGAALSGRWSIWKESRRVFMEHPIGGVGLDAHRAAVAPAIGQRAIYKKAEKEAHNTYLSVLAETGIVGFLLFAGIVAAVIARLRALVGWDRWYWSTQLAVLAIGGMSLSLEDSKSVWLFLSLAVATAATQAQPVAVTERRARGRAVGDVQVQS